MSLSSTAPSFSGDAAFVSHGVVAVHGDHVAVDDPTFLFSGAFERHGNDLWISRAFETRVVESYFDHGAEPLPLVAADGHWLPGRTVLAFTQGDHGPRYASNTAPDAPAAIGRVEGVDGNATAVRNGTVVLLHAGDFVYKGDAVATDAHGALAITFIDGTAFNLSAESKMVLDEMVYAPGGTGNKSLLSLVQGSINFVAGDVAHTGDMKVDTPVATMGIRGTAVHVEIGADNGPTHFSVMQEPNGRVGRYILYDRHDATKVLGSVGDGGMAYDLRYVGGHVVVEPAIKNAVELQHEHDFTKAVFTSFQAGAAHPLLRQLHEGPHVPIHATTHGSAAQTVTRPSSGDALSQPKPGSPTLGSDHDDRGSPTSSHGAQHHGAAHDAAGFSALIDVGASDVSVIPTLATLALVSMADAISSVRAVPAHPVPVTIMAPVPTPVETTTAPTPPATEPSTASTPAPMETSNGIDAGPGGNEHGIDTSRGGNEHDFDADPGGNKHGSDAGRGGNEHGSDAGFGGNEHGSDAGFGGDEHGSDADPGGNKHDFDTGPGGNKHGFDSDSGGNEHDSDAAFGGNEHGIDTSRGGNEHDRRRPRWKQARLRRRPRWKRNEHARLRRRPRWKRARHRPTPAPPASTAPTPTSTAPTAPAETSTAPTLASGETGTAKIPAAVNEVLHVKAGSILSSAAATVLINGHENLTAIVSAASGSIVSPVSANGTSIAGQHGTLIVTDAGTFAYAAASGSGLPAHASAADSFTFTVTGSGGASSTGSLTIVVDSLDQAPSIAYTAASVTEAGATGLASATAHATLADPDGDAVTVSTAGWTQGSAGGWTKSGTYGTATLHTATGDVSYALDAGRPGPAHGTSAVDSFAVTVGDGFGATTSGTASFTVGGVDRAPSIAYTAASVTEAGATGLASATAHATLADPDGDAVTVSTAGWTQGAAGGWTKSGTYGTATLHTATGDVSYALDAGRPGPAHGTSAVDSFAVTVGDGFGATTSGTASFTVGGADRAPSIAYTAASVTEAGATGLASATAHATLADPDGDAVTVSTAGWTKTGSSWTTVGLYGVATLDTATGNVAYTLDPTKQGPAHGTLTSDKFAVVAVDALGAMVTGNAVFTVAGADRAPSLSYTSATVVEPGATGVASATAHALPADADGDALTFGTVGWTHHANGTWTEAGLYGTATLNTATGDVSYVLDPAKASPAHGANASDSFTVIVADGYGATASGSATFHVVGADRAPTIGFTAASVTEAGATGVATATAHATLSDPDHDAVAVSTAGWTQTNSGWIQAGLYGTATLNTATGDVSYVLDPTKAGPAHGASATDGFAETVSDGQGATSIGTASFSVNGTDHAPTIGYTAATVTDGGASSAIAHATPGDVDGDAVVISTIGWTHNADGTWTQSGTYGTATLNTTSGDVSYALDPGKTGPASGTSGLESFAVAVNDGYGASATGLASFTVAAAAQNNPISGFTIGAQQLGNGQSVDVTLSGQFALPVANGLVTWDNGNDGHFVFTGVGGNFSTDEVLGAGNHVAVLTLSDPLHTMTATETVDINIGGSGNLVSSSTGGQSLLVGTRDGHAQTFVGSNQADTLLVLSGSNTLTGGGGGDTFVFATGNASGGFGNNEVTDFHASSANGAQDNIDLTAFHIANFNSLMSQATDHAAGVTLQLNGGSITLDHVAKASLHPELFHL